MLLNALIKWPLTIHLGYWPFVIHYAVDILNNTSGPSGFTPKEIFTGIKGERNLKNFCTFSSPACILNPALALGKKLPTWKPRSKLGVFIGKSRQHAGNVSLVHDPSTNFVSPSFHLVHDDDF